MRSCSRSTRSTRSFTVEPLSLGSARATGYVPAGPSRHSRRPATRARVRLISWPTEPASLPHNKNPAGNDRPVIRRSVL